MWERIGRARQKYKTVSGRYNITVEQNEGIAEKLIWTIKQSKTQDDKTKGVYFIRTNYKDPKENDSVEYIQYHKRSGIDFQVPSNQR